MTDEMALLAANATYYEAFVARDSEAMGALWAQDGVCCIHPGWPPLFGRSAVLASYRDIFNNPRQERIERRNETVLLGSGEGRVVCIESVGESLLVATNWFRRVENFWLLVHHQASPMALAPQEPRGRETRH